MGELLTDKLYYKIGEVARIAGVRTSVLRFWESEFEFLKPVKSTTGQRIYSRKEVELILQVRHLLYDEKFTIEGVKKRITPTGRLKNSDDLVPPQESADTLSSILKDIKMQLQDIQRQLKE